MTQGVAPPPPRAARPKPCREAVIADFAEQSRDARPGDPPESEAEESSLRDVLDRLEAAGDGRRVSINGVLEAFADRSLGVLLAVFALIPALPLIGAIPGVAVLSATLILLAILRSAQGGGPLHLPGRIGDKTVSEERFDRAIASARPWAGRVDSVLKERWPAFARGKPARVLITASAALLALTMYPLALVPFGVQAPATGIVALGLALMTRDGVAAAVGYALAGVTAWVLIVGA